MSSVPEPILAFTQGDPAGIGPEILLRLLEEAPRDYVPVFYLERAAVRAIASRFPAAVARLSWGDDVAAARAIAAQGACLAIDPWRGAEPHFVEPGSPTAADARGAMAAIDAAVQRTRRRGLKVAWVHLTHLNPLPPNLGEVLRRYPRLIVPELNLGQLCRLVRSEYLVDAKPVSKVQGLPFTAIEIENAIEGALQ